MKITEIILLVASVITALGVIFGAIKVILGMIVKKMLQPITNSVTSIDKRNCRRHLIDFLHDVENGEEKDDV